LKVCFLSLFLFLSFTFNCSAQVTTYSHEISVRVKLAKRLHEQINDWENRKSILMKIQTEYQQCGAAKSSVDRKVKEMQETDRDQGRKPRLLDKTYQAERDHLIQSMKLTVAVGTGHVNTYGDLVRWIAVYEKERPKNKLELERIEKDLQKAWTDLERTEKEIVILTNQRTIVGSKAALEGDWILSGGADGNNLVNVYYNEKDRHFYGTVTKSINMTCHPPGTILFSVTSSQGSDTHFSGWEYGYSYNQATGECRPQQVRLTIAVTGMSMTYNNGAQKLVLNRAQKTGPSPTLPIHRQDRRLEGFDSFDNL